MSKSENRPSISSITSGDELRRWYWRKDELAQRARELGLKFNSAKFDILERIAHFLDTGEMSSPNDKSPKPTSSFDWKSESLTLDTVITDNYKNTQNVRVFFKNQVGADFKFNIEFMEWIRANSGKTLRDACVAFLDIREQAKKPGVRTKIKSHNQFNQYTRDFLDDNPEMGMDDVRGIWALKIQQPSETGRHVYEPGDLKLGK